MRGATTMSGSGSRRIGGGLTRAVRVVPALALVVAGAAACGDRRPPGVVDATLGEPGPRAPLAAPLRVVLDEPSRIRLEVADGEERTTIEPGLAYRTEHAIPVLGLRPDRTHRVTVTAVDETGNRTVIDPFVVTTAPLPDDFPPLEVTSDPARVEPGMTVFAPFRWSDGGGPDGGYGLIVALDAAGTVVWYHRTDHSITNVMQLENGNLLYDRTVDGVRGQLVEITMLGDIVARWHPRSLAAAGLDDSIFVDVDTFHHDLVELATGNFLSLSSEVRSYDDYPSSEDDATAAPVTTTIVGDMVVEFARDGTVQQVIRLLDRLDPYRIGYGSLEQSFWTPTYRALLGEETEVVDWAHANALFYDEATDGILVSLRHQDAIVELDRASGDLRWILGPHEGWRPPWEPYLLHPTGALEWAFHSHGVERTPAGTILLYDNGNARAVPFAPPMPAAESYTRVVEYAVDAGDRTVRQVWSYGPDDERFYSSFLGDADWLPGTGHILMTDGARTRAAPADAAETADHNWARIAELTRTVPAETVFEIVIDDAPPAGWRVYRAQRLASLYGPPPPARP